MVLAFGFRAYGSGGWCFRVLGFRVWDLEFGMVGFKRVRFGIWGFRLQGLGCFGFGVSVLRVCGF